MNFMYKNAIKNVFHQNVNPLLTDY